MPVVAVVLETIEAQPLARLAPATTWLPFIWSTPSPDLNGTAQQAGVKVAVDVSVAWDLHPMVNYSHWAPKRKLTPLLNGGSQVGVSHRWRAQPSAQACRRHNRSIGLSNRTNKKGKVPPLPLLIHDDQADL